MVSIVMRSKISLNHLFFGTFAHPMELRNGIKVLHISKLV